MAKIIINGEMEVNGKLSISRDLDEAMGHLTTHKYFEEINKIESERYLVSDVEVVREDFGSNDFDILYTFTAKAKDITIKGGTTNLPEDVIALIEKDLYREEKNEKFHKEVYSSWIQDTK